MKLYYLILLSFFAFPWNTNGEASIAWIHQSRGRFGVSATEHGVFSIDGRNFDDTTQSWRLTWKATDLLDQEFASGVIPLNQVYGNKTFPITVKMPGYGFMRFTAELQDSKGNSKNSRQTTAVRLEQVNRQGSNAGFFGVCGHNDPTYVPVMAYGGCTGWRADFDYFRFAKEDGTFDFTEGDRLLEALETHQIAPLAIVGGRGDIQPGLEQGDMESEKKYLNYLNHLVDHFGTRINRWDLWNEPQYSWTGDPILFARLQTKAGKLLRQRNPSAEIVFNGHPFEEELAGYTITQLDSISGKLPFDTIGIHPYNRPKGPDDNDFLRHMKNIGQKLAVRKQNLRLQVTELGWPASTDRWGVSELTQASFLVRAMIYSLAAGVTRFYPYMTFSGPNISDGEHNYGFFNWGGTARPSFAAYATTAHLLGNSRFVRMLDLPPSLAGAIFERENESVLVLWAKHNSTELILKNRMPQGSLFRMDGSVWQEFSADHKKLLLSEVILFITTSSPQAWVDALEHSHLQLTQPISLDRSSIEGNDLVIALTNNDYLERDLIVSLDQLPDGITALNEKTKKLRISSDGAIIRFPLHIASGKIIRGEGKIQVNGDSCQLDFTIPLWLIPCTYRPGYSVDGKIKKWETTPLTAVNDRKNIAPVDLALFWRGIDDLSIERIALGWNEQGIICFVAVRDDQHDPLPPSMRAASINLWRNDSIQFAFNFTPGLPPSCYDSHTIEVAGTIADGKVLTHIFTGQHGPVLSAIVRDVDNRNTYYDFLIPWALLKMNVPKLGTTFSFNTIINDTDGKDGRQRYFIELAPGIGEEKNPSFYPRIQLQR